MKFRHALIWCIARLLGFYCYRGKDGCHYVDLGATVYLDGDICIEEL